MKRAEVWKDGDWLVAVWSGEIPAREQRIPERDQGFIRPVGEEDFPTHKAALAHALAEVGLSQPAEHREAP